MRRLPTALVILFFIDIYDCQSICGSTKCQIEHNWTQNYICDYIVCNYDSCEGGGYILWTKYVECSFNQTNRILIIISAIIYMILLFVMVSTVADNFFSPSISSIVAHLKISESVAGVTFMAFGNGAPDVFGSIASVLSSQNPKADLALGELFGGGLFVITMVVATIILTSPFDVEIFETVRDLSFYIITVIFIGICFITQNQVPLWMPLSLLGIYILYVGTVIAAQTYYNRKHKIQSKNIKYISSVVVASDESVPSNPIPVINIITGAIDKLKRIEEEEIEKNKNIHDDNEFVIIHGHVYHGHEARSRATSGVPPPMSIKSWRSHRVITDLLNHLKPWPNKKEWQEMSMLSKIRSLLEVIPTILFKLTIPLNELSWSKQLTLIHCFTCPIFVLFSIKMIDTTLFDESPGLWLYALILSSILSVFVIFFTKLGVQPKYYKEISSYTGFLMSISWIYLISSEVVNVVTMLGVVSRISHEVLGLTILAWSNSIGDLIADISVVKQGYPRMAMAAAIGGPLFNLLIGFGLPFSIAKIQGKYIEMIINPIYILLISFLLVSLFTTLIGIPVQKCHLNRPHAFLLILIYAIFIVFLILTETHLI